MLNFPWILFLKLLLLHTLEAYKALVLLSVPVKSHSILGDSLVQLIAEAGNEVTYLTAYPRKNPPARVKEIAVFGEKDKTIWSDNINLTAILNGEIQVNKKWRFITRINKLNSQILQNIDVQKLMKDPNEKFDVIIAEWIYNDIFAGLSPIFDCPLIWLSTMEQHWKILQLIDEKPNPAYNADVTYRNRAPLTFLQRVQELLYQMHGLFLDYFYVSRVRYDQYMNFIAPNIRKRGKKVPDFEELRFNASLVLGNSHISLGSATRLPMNYKQIAGYHIPKTPKPLTGDLKKLLDNATHGVIYFSLGSNLKSKSIPEVLKVSLLKMFGGLKQTVLWKFEDDVPNTPKNVHILQWAPQTSILAHKNCIVFISHGGFLSMAEAIHFEKPFIGIPVLGDQFSNMVTAVQKGFAIKIDLSYTMADKIHEAIQEIISNPSYATKAKEFSFIYFHRPVSPAKELVHWVEHVVQTRGALHLRSPALSLHWHQKFYLDFVLVVLVVIFGLRILISRLCFTLRRKKSSTKNKTE